uniref:Aspartate/homoserine dehydrogenase NAD-binding domain-containing protein n=1 Tax=mine drainage metagenome TaxID=410659 RepID=E6QS71_9ZZZZ
MAHQIRIALIGLGRVGETFAINFLERIQMQHIDAKIVAVADHKLDSPVMMGFAHSGASVFTDGLEIVKMGDQVDIIFDLSGNAAFRQKLRDALREGGNQHTVIAPEIIANLVWAFFGEKEKMPSPHEKIGY